VESDGEDGDVVAGLVANHVGEDGIEELIQLEIMMVVQGMEQTLLTGVDAFGAGFDEAVGVEQQRRTERNCVGVIAADGAWLHPEQKVAGVVKCESGPVGVDKDRCGVTGVRPA